MPRERSHARFLGRLHLRCGLRLDSFWLGLVMLRRLALALALLVLSGGALAYPLEPAGRYPWAKQFSSTICYSFSANSTLACLVDATANQGPYGNQCELVSESIGTTTAQRTVRYIRTRVKGDGSTEDYCDTSTVTHSAGRLNTLVTSCDPDTGTVLTGDPPNQTCECPASRFWNEGLYRCTGCGPGATVSSGYYDIGTDPANSPGILTCQQEGDEGGCEAIFDGTSPEGHTIQGGVKTYFAKGRYVLTGNTCDTHGTIRPLPDGNPNAPEDGCAAGEVQGTINGRVVCVNQETGEQTESSKDAAKSETTTTTETLPDGSVKETTTAIRCDSKGNCDKVTTTKTTSPSGSTTTSETRTPVSGTGNPSSGSSADGEEGTDDEEPTPECEEGDTTLRCLTLGAGVDDVPIGNIDVGVGITPDSRFEREASCPADKVLSLAQVTLTVPFTLLCDAADMARPIVVGVAWLSALLGFVGIGRRD